MEDLPVIFTLDILHFNDQGIVIRTCDPGIPAWRATVRRALFKAGHATMFKLRDNDNATT